MPTGDNNITLTIQAVDASGPAVQQFTTRVVGAANSATEATNRYKSALEQLGPAAQAGNAQAASIIQQYKAEAEQAAAATRAAGVAGAGAGEQIGSGMRGAYGQMRLVSGLGREMGLNIDYGLRRVLTTIPGVTSGLTALLPIFGAIGLAALFVPLIEGAVHFVEEISDVNKAMDAFIDKAQEAAQQKLIDSGSIETTDAGLEQIGDELDQLSKKQAHWKEQWRIDFTNQTLPGAGFFQYLIPTSDIWNQGDDQRTARLAELQKKGQEHLLDASEKVTQEQLRGQQAYDDAVDKGYAKISAHERDAVAEIQARYAVMREKEQETARAAGVKPVDLERTYSTQEAAEISRAQQEAAGQRIALSRTEAEAVIHAQNEALDSGLRGEALYLAKRNQDVDAIVRKQQQGELSMQGAAAETASAYQRYENERLQRIQQQYDEAAKMERQAATAGLTGIPRIQAEQADRLAEVDQGWQHGTSDLGADWHKRQAIQAQTNQQMTEAQQRFDERIAQLDQHAADQMLSGYAKIDGEARSSINALDARTPSFTAATRASGRAIRIKRRRSCKTPSASARSTRSKPISRSQPPKLRPRARCCRRGKRRSRRLPMTTRCACRR